MDKKKVLDLAKLARIEIGDGEAESLSHEFDAILGYVGEIKNAGFRVQDSRFMNKAEFPVRNVMREDTELHESSLYTKKILEQAPRREGDYIKVKKIL